MKRRSCFFLFSLFLAAFGAPSGLAASTPWQNSAEASARLVSKNQGVKDQKETFLGLEIRLAEGWHTYGRDPGDAGEPPRFDWKGSENLASVEILYPPAIGFSMMGIETMGYKDRVLLPLRAEIKNVGEPLKVRAIVNLLLCKEICVPQSFAFALDLPADTSAPSEEASLIAESPALASPSAAPAKALPLWSVLFLALLGGFILNLMPCVLPVLSLKVMGLIRHGGGEARAIRHSFSSTAAGIVFSFLLLALATIGLKAAGQSVGWGIQFQQPVFLVFMIALLTFFTANLWGFFEIGIPAFIADWINPRHHPKLAGDFATGALATLLATPCSAPFLGTAIAFAMAAGAAEIVAVFAALGVGMSLPYLAVALWPKLARKLPKPGAWMETLSRLLGFGLAGTVLWLLNVLAAQMGTDATVLIALAMVAMVGQLYLRHKNVLHFLTKPVIAAALLASFGLAYVASAPSSASVEMGAWKKFDEETLARHVGEGKTVFVDVTADWCLTCKVNKRFALTRDDVRKKLFETEGVIALQADWTNADPSILAFLKKHERYGIPFNIVFGPKAPQGIPLPEILTPSSVIEAIERAQNAR